MLAKFDDLLNSITMYRLVLYSLLWLVGVAMLFSVLGVLDYPPLALVGVFSILMTVGFIVNTGLAKLYGITTNFESGIITTLILFFVLAVPTTTLEWLAIGIGTFIALASKYVLTWRGAHIFNPVAFGVVVIGLSGLSFASWWIATPIMLPFVAVVAVLILRKTRRFGLFFSFIIPCIALLLAQGNNLQVILLSFPIIFFASVMLTEPATSPNTNKWRLFYGFIIGIIVGAGMGVFSSPQVALLIGNLLAFVVSFRVSAKLKLVSKTQLSENMYDFAFKTDKKFTFLPGQYMDWTLPGVGFNSRGNRRSFTIASSPSKKELHIGVKFYEPSSKFKQQLLSLEKGDYIYAGRVAGDFLLPRSNKQKLVFVAGGIGITPFISMLQHLIMTKQKRDITLFYFVNSDKDIVYKDILEKAKKHGLEIIPMIGPKSRLDKKLLQTYIPDYMNREFYLSGPPAMVRSYKASLKNLSVKKIHTDYFSGY